jgi:hypothetical protein
LVIITVLYVSAKWYYKCNVFFGKIIFFSLRSAPKVKPQNLQSLHSPAQHVGVGDTSISIAIKNRTASKGYFWKFADEKNN